MRCFQAIFLAITLCFSLYGNAQKNDFRKELDSFIRQHYPKEGQAVIDSIAKFWSGSIVPGGKLYFNTLIQVNGKRFYRKSFTENGSIILDSLLKDLPSGIISFEPFLDPYVGREMYYPDPINEVWDFNRLELYPVVSPNYYKHLFDSLFTIYCFPELMPKVNEISKNENDLIHTEIDHCLLDDSWFMLHYYWFYWKVSEGKGSEIKPYIKSFREYLDNNIQIPPFSKAFWYISLAKLYNTVEYEDNYLESHLMLANAEKFMNKVPNSINFRLIICGLKAENLGRVPGLHANNLAVQLFYDFRKKNYKKMNHDHEMKILAHIGKFEARRIEIKYLENSKINYPIDLHTSIYNYYKYLSEDRGAYGYMVNRTLLSLLHWEGKHEKMLRLSFMTFQKITDYRALTEKEMVDLIMTIGSGIIYTQNKDFLFEMLDSASLQLKAMNKGLLKYVIKRILKKNSKELADVLYYSQYGINPYRLGNLVFSSIDSIELTQINITLKDLLKNRSSIQGVFNNILEKDPLMDYYIRKNFERMFNTLAWRKAHKKKWKKAYYLKNVANHFEPNEYSKMYYSLGKLELESVKTKEVYDKNKKLFTLEKKERNLRSKNYQLGLKEVQLSQSLEKLGRDFSLREVALNDSIKYKENLLKINENELFNLRLKRDSLINDVHIAKDSLNLLIDSIGTVTFLNQQLEKLRAQESNKKNLAIILMCIIFTIFLYTLQLYFKKERLQLKWEVMSKANLQIAHLGKNFPDKIRYALEKKLNPNIKKQIQFELNALKKFGTFLDEFNSFSWEPETSCALEIPLIKKYVNLRYGEELQSVLPSDKIILSEKIIDNIKLPVFVLLNLINNAFAHGGLDDPSNGSAKVSIDLIPHSNFYELTVIDNGTGNLNRNKEKINTSGKKKTSTGQEYIEKILRAWNRYFFSSKIYFGNRQDGKKGYESRFRLLKNYKL